MSTDDREQFTLPLGNQRWAEGRASYRPATETIRPVEYDVAPMPHEGARAFIETHHYSRSYPAARVRLGLYRHGALAGVAVFSQPTNDASLTNVFPTVPVERTVELGRFVLLDEVPGNGETWFLARCFDHLRSQGFAGVLSFSDPVPRRGLDGHMVFPGHIGTIYQAHNARYLGRSTASTLRLLPDGLVFSRRTMQKVRAGERGWLGAVAQLAPYGAPALEASADRPTRVAWLHEALASLTRPLVHPGNHRYAWSLIRRVQLPASQPYPKQVA